MKIISNANTLAYLATAMMEEKRFQRRFSFRHRRRRKIMIIRRTQAEDRQTCSTYSRHTLSTTKAASLQRRATIEVTTTGVSAINISFFVTDK